MDIATIAGLFLGIAILIVSLVMGGVPVQTIFQPEALLVVMGGTLTAMLVNFSGRELLSAMRAMNQVFYLEDLTPQEVIDYISDAAVYIRTKGLLAVQPLLNDIDIPFLQKGLQMLVDNTPLDHMRALLTTEMEVQYTTDKQHAKIFETAGGFAPTMGIIGAIVGLVQIMNMLHSPEQLGHGVASAFIATLYGVGSANLFFLPVAGKLQHRAKHAWLLRSMILQGILAIREGKHPTLIREQLSAYLYANDETAGVDEGYEGYDTQSDLYAGV